MKEVKKLTKKKNLKAITLALITLLMFSMTYVAFVQANGTHDDPIHIPTGGGIYEGNLNETQDMYYDVTVYLNHLLNVTLIVPGNYTDFDLSVESPPIGDGNHTYYSTNDPGINENITRYAEVGGVWLICVFRSYEMPGGNYTLIVDPTNHVPTVPSVPSGPSSGNVYTNIQFTTSTTDADSDTIAYEFSWDDGTANTVTGYYASGAIATATHQWTYPISYHPSVRAKDYHGNWTEWSETTTITLGQNDFGTGGDASDSLLNPTFLSNLSYNVSKGTLYVNYAQDNDDIYSFNLSHVGDRVHAKLTPPATADFNLILYDPNLVRKNESCNPANGAIEELTYNVSGADTTGNWVLCVSRKLDATSEGQYTLLIEINPYDSLRLTVGVSDTAPGGTKIWIDGILHYATTSSPVTVLVTAGMHTIQAQDSWSMGLHWWYFFDQWSDGVYSNPRSMNITQDTTITANYVLEYRGPGPIPL